MSTSVKRKAPSSSSSLKSNNVKKAKKDVTSHSDSEDHQQQQQEQQQQEESSHGDAVIETAVSQVAQKAEQSKNFLDAQKWQHQLTKEKFDEMIIEPKTGKSANIDFYYSIKADKKSEYPPNILSEELQIKFQNTAGLGSAFDESKAAKSDYKNVLYLGAGAPPKILELEAKYLASDEYQKAAAKFKASGKEADRPKYIPIAIRQENMIKRLKERVNYWVDWAWKCPQFKKEQKVKWRNDAQASIARQTKVKPKDVPEEAIDVEAKAMFVSGFRSPIADPEPESKHAGKGTVIKFNRKVWSSSFEDQKEGAPKKKAKASNRKGKFKDAANQAIFEKCVADGFVYNAPVIRGADGKTMSYPDDMETSLVNTGDLVVTRFKDHLYDLKADGKYGLHFQYGDIQLIRKGPKIDAQMQPSESFYAKMYKGDDDDEEEEKSTTVEEEEKKKAAVEEEEKKKKEEEEKKKKAAEEETHAKHGSHTILQGQEEEEEEEIVNE